MRLKTRRLLLPLFFATSVFSSEDYQISLPQFAEQHAASQYEKKYSSSPEYTVLRNISYAKRKGKRPGHILGELDIIVLKGDEIVEIVEVKYTNSNAGKARRKGRDQLQRFAISCVLKQCIFVKDGQRLDLSVPNINKIKLGFILYQGTDESHLMDEYHQFGLTDD